MAIRNYQWSAGLTIRSGGFIGENITISDGSQTKSFVNTGQDIEFLFGAHTETSETGSATFTYTYEDSDFNGHLTRVSLTIRESWTASVNNVTNKLRVTVSTELVTASRTSLDSITPEGRIWHHIVKRSVSGAVLAETTSSTSVTGNIPGLTNKDLGSYTFELNPGTGISQPSIWYRNVLSGYEYLQPEEQSIYQDVFGIGIHFKNILPPPTTYRITYDANGGTGAPAQQTATTAEGSYTFTVPSGSPTWGSYKFLGWSRTQYSRTCTDADVEYRAGDTITLQESSPTLTLYACWEKDYRPGKIIDNGGIWQSHNRPTGADNIRTASNWQTMRTIDGAVGTDNPPYMMHPSEFKNQRKIGNNA